MLPYILPRFVSDVSGGDFSREQAVNQTNQESSTLNPGCADQRYGNSKAETTPQKPESLWNHKAGTNPNIFRPLNSSQKCPKALKPTIRLCSFHKGTTRNTQCNPVTQPPNGEDCNSTWQLPPSNVTLNAIPTCSSMIQWKRKHLQTLSQMYDCNSTWQLPPSNVTLNAIPTCSSMIQWKRKHLQTLSQMY